MHITAGDVNFAPLPSPKKKRRVTFDSTSSIENDSPLSIVSSPRSTRSTESVFDFLSDCYSPKEKEVHSEDYTNLGEQLQSLRVTPSDFLMFPHMCERFVNEDGNDISSHMILLPSGREKEQITFEVTGNSKQFNLHYSYPEAMMAKETIEKACDMHENCANVTVLKKNGCDPEAEIEGRSEEIEDGDYSPV